MNRDTKVALIIGVTILVMVAILAPMLVLYTQHEAIVRNDARITSLRADVATDLAMIKIDTRNLPTLKIGNSGTLKIGQPVAAVGNALGLGISMTGGWVSRLNISIALSDGRILSGLIETDVVVKSGSSGGPLINLDGEVIGIATHKIVRPDIEGIGHAIDINKAMLTINSLLAEL